ncbi:hypothetical protein GDO81_008871 [Engystomops pustulosus]|uniref:Zona pellucida sperm-binding protein 3 n=1 Tax=Engystomops pustulosus TaxID=76066 RepID=A0AAV7BMI2_ENGPU|nr:hypothetical protein GDO81_008871 [Engystomops pustulosus]
MELWVRWLVLVLLYGSGFGSVLARQRRQSDAWWRSHQPGWGQPASRLGSSRGVIAAASRPGAPRGDFRVQPVSGFGALRGAQSASGWGTRYSGRDFQSRQLPPSSSPISVQCAEDRMVVTVVRDFYGNGKLVKPSDLSLGSCQPTAVQPNDVVFENGLHECGSDVEHDWSGPRDSLVFQLGDLFYIEASLDTKNHEPMMLFVDSCVATTNEDVTSTPRYEIISNNGCLMDGKEVDSSSVFVSPRTQANILRFMVDAFRFTDSAVSMIYITCSLRAAAINQSPDPMNKACSYNKASSSWSPIEGPSGICQCCTTGNCATAGGQRMSWGSSHGRPRGLGKRDTGSHVEKHGRATLGPLLVTGAKSNQISGAGTSQASRMSAGREPLQLWVLVAIGSVSAVVVAVVLAIVGKCLLKRFSHKESVEINNF